MENGLLETTKKTLDMLNELDLNYTVTKNR